MAIIDDHRAFRPDGLLTARAYLPVGRSAGEGTNPPVVVIVRDAGPHSDLDDEDNRIDGEGTAPLPEGTVPGDLPTLDAWIVDLSMRHERVTVVGPTDVLCSAPLIAVPRGWMSEVAASGLLAVVVRPGPERTADGPPVPVRARAAGALLAAFIPVCLSE